MFKIVHRVRIRTASPYSYFYLKCISRTTNKPVNQLNVLLSLHVNSQQQQSVNNAVLCLHNRCTTLSRPLFMLTARSLSSKRLGRSPATRGYLDGLDMFYGSISRRKRRVAYDLDGHRLFCRVWFSRTTLRKRYLYQGRIVATVLLALIRHVWITYDFWLAFWLFSRNRRDSLVGK